MIGAIFTFAQLEALRTGLRSSSPGQDVVPEKFHTPIVWYALENANNEEYWKNVNPGKMLLILRKGKSERDAGIHNLLSRWGANRVVGRSIQPNAINFITVEFPNPTRERVLSFINEAKSIPDIVVAEPEVIFKAQACRPNDTY